MQVYVSVRVAAFQADLSWTGEPGLVEAQPVGASWKAIDWTQVSSARVSVANPFDASVVISADHSGKVLLVEKSDESMAAQALRAQAAGAIAIVVVNDVCESTFPWADLAPQVLPGPDGLLVTIPVLVMEREPGLRLKEAAIADTSTGNTGSDTLQITITTGYVTRACPRVR